ncbi:MAG: hypothetical protein ACRERE_16085 [Candidatus Entotheonellia bacterium]
MATPRSWRLPRVQLGVAVPSEHGGAQWVTAPRGLVTRPRMGEERIAKYTTTPDGVVKDVTGIRWDAAAGGVRGFASHFLRRPHRRGGQHHVQHLLVEPADGGGYRVTSYWVSI